MAPQTLWCSEFLTDSPSTTSSWSCSSVSEERTAPQHRAQTRHSTRKQPFAVLSISPFVEQQQLDYQSENVFPCKSRQLDQSLNSAQRQFVPVDLDKTIHWDNRTLISLLNSEKHYKRFEDPRKLINVQNDFNYVMYRSEAARWLYEVCIEENCDFGIFPLAVSYLNRALFLHRIPPTSLQALASACLFIASKMKAPHPITAKHLSQYSDGYVSADEILKWEIFITNILKWNLSLCTVFEFFDQLMVRAPDLEFLRESFCNVAYSIQIDDELSHILPSVQCALGVCFLTLDTTKWLEYRKLVKLCLDVDFHTLKHYVYKLNPKLTESDLEFFQLTTEKHCQRRSAYQNSTNPFVALV
ncbi:Cyclin N-terminal domain-containing protein [Aphelenchoides bicaudatus]|nr:Cyclin N-terminal domain-containing protein [Aphelenchoides bicaudatus]